MSDHAGSGPRKVFQDPGGRRWRLLKLAGLALGLRTLYLIASGRPTGWNKVERTATVEPVLAAAEIPAAAAQEASA